jgi:hypothetical protein
MTGACILWYGSVYMKTTIEIGEDLMQRSKEVLRRQGGTLLSLVEEGLLLALECRELDRKSRVKPVTFRGRGLQPEFQDASWGQIHEAIYGRRSH